MTDPGPNGAPIRSCRSKPADPKRAARGRRAHAAGLDAEDTAARLLTAAGLEILERRCRTPHGEIDIVARDGDGLVFVEVKQRRDRSTAAHALTERQWIRLAAAAEHFAAVYRTSTNSAHYPGQAAPPDMRFDVVLVGRDGHAERIENARRFDEW